MSAGDFSCASEMKSLDLLRLLCFQPGLSALTIVLASSDNKLIFQVTFFLFLLKEEMCHTFMRLLSPSTGATDSRFFRISAYFH